MTRADEIAISVRRHSGMFHSFAIFGVGVGFASDVIQGCSTVVQDGTIFGVGVGFIGVSTGDGVRVKLGNIKYNNAFSHQRERASERNAAGQNGLG